MWVLIPNFFVLQSTISVEIRCGAKIQNTSIGRPNSDFVLMYTQNKWNNSRQHEKQLVKRIRIRWIVSFFLVLPEISKHSAAFEMEF